MSRELLAAWQRTLRRHGSRVALTDAASGRQWTFGEIAAGAEAWRARHLPDPDVIRGRRAVFALPNGPAWLETFLGIAQAGGTAVPLDPGEPVSAQRGLATRLRAGWWWQGSHGELLSSPCRARREPPLLAKLTSGSTGAPRALLFSAAQMLADARQVTGTMGIGADDLNYALIPFGHSYGLGNLALPLIAHGVPLVLASSALPQAIAVDFARWRPTVFPGVPAVWRALAESDLGADALASLRLAISAGAPLPVGVAQRFATRFGRRLHSFYGASETGGIAYDRDGRATLAGGVGRALHSVRLALGPGQRLRVCSPAVVTHGNSRREGQLGCWLMPDRVERAPNGDLVLLGRRGSLVKIGGRRVSLEEVAAALRRLPGVSDAWVTAQGEPEAILGAAVATNRPVATLRAELRSQLPAWKIPRRWITYPALPLTARGKVDTAVLRQALFPA